MIYLWIGLAAIVLIVLIALFLGANYLYNLALNPKRSKDAVFHAGDEADRTQQTETSGICPHPSKIGRASCRERGYVLV